MELHRTSGRWKLGLALSLCTVLLWGMLPIALKALLRGLDALTISWFRFLLACLLLVAWYARSGELVRLLRAPGKGRLLLLVAALGLCGNYVFYLFGLRLITPAAAQVLIQLAPLSMLLGGMVIFGERFILQQWLGLALLLLGQGLFFLPGLAGGGGTAHSPLGLALMVVAALSWGAYALAQKQLQARWPSQLVLCVVYGLCALLLSPFAHPGHLPGLGLVNLSLLLFTVFNTLVAYGTFSEALNHLEASRVGVILSTTPLFTITFVHLGAHMFPGLVDADPLPPSALAGAALVVAGSALSALRRRRVPASATIVGGAVAVVADANPTEP